MESVKLCFPPLTFIRSEASYLHRSAFFPLNLVTSELNTAAVWDCLSWHKPSNASGDSLFFPFSSSTSHQVETCLQERASWKI